jgi:hypothetical protein
LAISQTILPVTPTLVHAHFARLASIQGAQDRAPAMTALLENYRSHRECLAQTAVLASMLEMTLIACFAQQVSMHLSRLLVAVCLVLPVSRQTKSWPQPAVQHAAQVIFAR